MLKDAEISADGRYRYWLSRRWDDRPPVVFIMLNPSTADAEYDDPTIRRCISFAQAWGYGALEVVNLFGFRATQPAALRLTRDPVGPGNAIRVENTCRGAPMVVCAWGTLGDAFGGNRREGRHGYKMRKALREMGIKPHALGLTKNRNPSHPLYLPGTLTPRPFDELLSITPP